MELTVNKKTAVETANESIQNQIDTLSTKKIERVKSFREYAFEKAGLNRGNYLSLKTHLKWITDGHLVDDSYNENEQQLLKLQVQNKISAKEEEKEKTAGEKRAAEEVTKPFLEKKIKDLNEEIQQTQLDLIDNKVHTGYQPEKYFMWVAFTALLSLYLLFFYSSTIYSCFFRNPIDILKNGGSDISLALESIFDIKGIFTPSIVLIVPYLGSFIFFVIGMIPHNVKDGKFKNLKITFALLLSFVVDCLMAYKIDLGIHNLKEMADFLDQNWHFYTSINFYMVLVFGFLAYLVWGYAFEMMLIEKNKKSGNIKADLIIKGLKAEIVTLREELKNIETKIIDLETQIKTILAQLEQLKKELENRMLNPDSLSQNLNSFYMGWLQYLSGTSELNHEKEKCDAAFNEFIQSQFNQTVTAN
jgi:hypothetical protein